MKKYDINGSKVYCQSMLPAKGFIAMAIYGMIFWRSDYAEYLDKPKYAQYVRRTVNHENIHTAQMRDFCKWLPIGGTIFYICYFFEWLGRLFTEGVKDNKAYRALSFEKEARENESDLEYLSKRKRFAMWRKRK